MHADEWPPADGKRFVHSEQFGSLLLEIVWEFEEKYPHLDFTDATAMVFAWFDRKLAQNRRFINRDRFPTPSSFRAYVKQSVWNAGRLSERQRDRHEALEEHPGEESIAIESLTPEERASLMERADDLPFPQKEVFERIFFYEETAAYVASVLDRTEEEIHEIYDEALDSLMS